MSNSLINQFNGWPLPFTPEAEMINREQQMLQLSKEQIIAQKTAIQKVVSSNILGASMVSSEIQHQTQILESAIFSVGNQIYSAVQSSTDQIVNMLDIVGDQICFSLDEIKWELIQQNAISNQILEVLRENRSNEARQLVNQGVRHYVNAQYEKAEDRFKEALKFDTTDYQVLMNLAYIEIHKGNAKIAYEYFKDALNLPDNLDTQTKAVTLWAMDRLRYAEKNYDDALELANQANKMKKNATPRAFYTLGVYSALSGKQSEALSYIKKAIKLNHSYFSIASAETDLEKMREKIFALLFNLSTEAESKASKVFNKVKQKLKEAEAYQESKEYVNLIGMAKKKQIVAKNLLTKKTFSQCNKAEKILTKILTTVSKMDPFIADLKMLYSKRKKSKQDLETEQMNPSSKEKAKDEEAPLIMSYGIPSLIYLGTALVFLIQEIMKEDNIFLRILTGVFGIFIAAFWPIIVLIGFGNPLQGYPLFKYSLILIVISIVLSFFWYHFRKRRNEVVSSVQDKLWGIKQELKDMDEKIGEYNNKAKELFSEIKQIT